MNKPKVNSSTGDQPRRSLEIFDPRNDNNVAGTRSTDVQAVEVGSGSSPTANATSGSSRVAVKKSKSTSDHDDSITDQPNEDQVSSSHHNNLSSTGQSPSSSNKILTEASIAKRTAE